MVVKDQLLKLGLPFRTVELGEADLFSELTPDQLLLFRDGLLHSGLELMDDKKSVLIQQIKNVIIEQVHYAEDQLLTNMSDHLAIQLQHNYTYLANLFSEVTGTTIEKFFIHQKIEKVKEMLVYNEHNLTEIAWIMHYSSVAHLSNQFKRVTGLTPSHFKKLRDKRRNMLEDL